jgi:hypothetical protein
MEYQAEITKLRRFSLTIGLILLVYSIAGVQLDSPAKIAPLGIPLIIRHPELLGIGLVLASVYGTLAYFYYANIVVMSPMKVRRLLQSGGIFVNHCFEIAKNYTLGDDTPFP